MQSSVVQIGHFSYYPNKIVGQGATGSVYLGFRNQDKAPVAVKAIKLQQIDTEIKRHLLRCEVSALRAVKNRYVCKAYDILKDGEFYFVPQQYCPNGTLHDYIKKKGKLAESEALSMFVKIMEGYSAIKQAGYIHRDLKSENILLRSNFDPVIIDFGYCEKAESQGRIQSYNVGSPAYMSPEAYNDSIYSEKSDVWALGIVFHQMLTGTMPFMRANVDEYFKYLKNLKTAQIQGQQNSLCMKILLNSLAVDTRLRYSSQQLLDLVNRQMGVISHTLGKANSLNIQPTHFQEMSYPLRAPGNQLYSSFDLGFSVGRSSKNNLNIQSYAKTNNQKSSVTTVSSSSKKFIDCPTLDFKQTIFNSPSENTRKRSQVNGNYLKNTVVPAKNLNLRDLYQSPQYLKQPHTPKVSFTNGSVFALSNLAQGTGRA